MLLRFQQSGLARAAAVCAVLTLAAIQCLGAQPASAQTFGPRAEWLDPAYGDLFRQTRARPADVDLALRFAAEATRLGDYEAAIGALERVLFYAPQAADVQYQLGLLYYRLGANESARVYFQSAAASERLSASLRTRAGEFVAEIDRRAGGQAFSVTARAGMRYQSNAVSGPSSRLIVSGGLPALANPAFAQRSDWNAFASATIGHVFDFENQRGDTWESSLGLYGAKYARIDRLDSAFAELRTGPRLALAPDDWPGLTFRPYGIVGGLLLGSEPYLGTIGAGASVGMRFGNAAVVEPYIELRSRRFRSSTDFVGAGDLSGEALNIGVAAYGYLVGPVRWYVRAAYTDNGARRNFYEYDGFSLDVGLPVDLGQVWPIGRAWSVTPTFGVSTFDYGAPNPLVDPARSRQDTEWRVGALLDVAITDRVGLGLQVQYSTSDSNIANYDTRNVSVSFGPTLRF